jgi:hypothetical protein
VFQTNALNSATLSPVTLNVCAALDEFGNCVQTVPLTIRASWTGTGTQTTNAKNDVLESVGPGGLIDFFGGASTVRPAIAAGSLNSQLLGQSSSADIFKFERVNICGVCD